MAFGRLDFPWDAKTEAAGGFGALMSGGEGASIRIEPLGEVIGARPGETIMQAALRQGIRWPTICNGVAICGVCHVRVRAASLPLLPPSAKEAQGLKVVAQLGPEPVRLACQLVPQGEMVVWRPGAVRVRPLS